VRRHERDAKKTRAVPHLPADPWSLDLRELEAGGDACEMALRERDVRQPGSESRARVGGCRGGIHGATGGWPTQRTGLAILVGRLLAPW
jgi:hypothetical protein